MKQTKNYTPSELITYKTELEQYISTEWNKPILTSEITIDVFSGKYTHSRENASADLEIKYAGGNILQIQGMAFYGTNNEAGPNIGDLDCVAEIIGTKAVFRDKFHDEEYVLEVTFLGNRISVSDNYIMGYYGNGVSFSGEYHKEIPGEHTAGTDNTAMQIMNVAVYGCFTVKSDKNIVIESISDEINAVIQNSIKTTISKIYSYKHAILLHYAQMPDDNLIALNYEKLNQQIKLKVHDIGHIASIHFLNNEVEHTLHTIINYNENVLNYAEPSEIIQRLSNLLLNSNELTRSELITLCLNLFYLVYSQIHLDMMLGEEDYKNLHYTLDGCQKLASEIKSSSDRLNSNTKVQVNDFLNFWSSHCERYRAIALASEKEFHGAVSSIFRAISHNPFYPYRDYASLKADYSKRYALELVPKFNEMQELFPEIDTSAEENTAIAEELSRQIEFKEISYNYNILLSIMYENQDNKDLIIFIEQELEKLDNNSPFILITKSEIIRYLKKGRRRINKMYRARIDDTIEYLRKAITLDPDFPVLYTKMGSILLMKGTHSFFGGKSIIEGVEMYKKGAHFLAQLGFRTRPMSTTK